MPLTARASGATVRASNECVAPSSRRQPPSGVVDCDSRGLHELGTGLLGDGAERHTARASERKRLGDRHGAKREIWIRRDQLEVDPITGERMHRQQCLQASDTTTDDDDLHLTNRPPVHQAWLHDRSASSRPASAGRVRPLVAAAVV